VTPSETKKKVKNPVTPNPI